MKRFCDTVIMFDDEKMVNNYDHFGPHYLAQIFYPLRTMVSQRICQEEWIQMKRKIQNIHKNSENVCDYVAWLCDRKSCV